MRKSFVFVFLLVLIAFSGAMPGPADAATTSAATPVAAKPVANPSSVTLSPEQAREALAVLNDPVKRTQIQDTLRAVAAAGALATPPIVASAGSASAAPAAATSASGPASVLAKSLTSNGLASQLSHDASHWAGQFGGGLRRSMAALLDYGSAEQWWRDRTSTETGRTLIRQVAWAVALSLLPALALQYLVARFLRGLRARIADRGIVDADDNQPELKQEERAAEHAEDVAERSGNEAALQVAERRTKSVRGERHAARHWTLLQRLPSAILHTSLAIVPLVVFVVVATVVMSIAVDDGTPQDRAIDALINVYTICSAVIIVSGFFLAPSAPGLRLISMRDRAAIFTHAWIVRIVYVAGAGSAIAEGAQPLGLTDSAHDAIMKTVALVAHLMIALVIIRCRRPVAEWIRDSMRGRRSFVLLGNWIADVWAGLAVFFVLALWFVWALDVHNGYRTLFHLFGISVLVLVCARVVAIVAFGALGRIFRTNAENDELKRSIVHRHAYRYYPFLRRAIQTVIVVVTLFVLLEVWGIHALRFFASGGVGHSLASALITIAVAALFAVLVWEIANVAVENRLELWNASGDRLRAARLTTLLPMMRSALFIVIAMVVVFTGLSEIGVNTGPLLASASIFGVALGFGSQKLVQDLITGIFLLMENAMQVGDSVTLAGVSGTVEYLSIRTVRLRGGDGSLFTVPFSSVSTVNNTNRGIGNAAVRVSIALGEDVELAANTLKEIGQSLREDDTFKTGILSDFSLWGVDAVDGSSVTLAGQLQCSDTARWGVQREFNRRIHDRFRALGIVIANPQRNFVIMTGGDGADTAGQVERVATDDASGAAASGGATADHHDETAEVAVDGGPGRVTTNGASNAIADPGGARTVTNPPSGASTDPSANAVPDQRGARTMTGEPSNAPPERSNPSRP
jgi:moderate conductance mechanosensitive channel